MDIARASIEKPVNTWLIALICLIGGLYAFTSLGRLEDPAFTIKEAMVVTSYPGASAQEVEAEVTEWLERAIQELPQLKEVTSRSLPGLSEIRVEVQPTYGPNELPQVWDELRRKINDAQRRLPPGAGPSLVDDDFGDVFGLFFALTGDGYRMRELHEVARFLQRELLTVPGVAKVQLGGIRDEQIFVEIGQEKLVQLGMSPEQIFGGLNVQNSVRPAGALRLEDTYLRLRPTGSLDGVAAVADYLFAAPGGDSLLRLGDIAEVVRDYREVPSRIIRHNGDAAITIGVAGAAGVNIVDVGTAVRAHLALLEDRLPVGVEVHSVYDQSGVVDEAVNGFMLNVLLSVSVVILVLCVAMGLRAGAVVGLVLLLTVLGTLLVMRLTGIEMQRVSLGALILAMGMLVDNAIVVAEGMLVRLQQGMGRIAAASDVVRRTQWPLLAATVIGLLAFSGIGLSPDATGEFTFSLFAVISISLLLSWLLAVTVTPLFGHYLLRVEPAARPEAVYGGLLYRAYHASLRLALRQRAATVLLLVSLTGSAVWGFQFIKQGFFPTSTTPVFFVDYWRSQGTDIRATSDDTAQLEQFINALPGVVQTTTFVGQGADRMMLIYRSEMPNSAYGQFMIRTEDHRQIPAVARSVVEHVAEHYPDAATAVRRVRLGPGGGYDLEVRFSGPDPQVLRGLAEEAQAIFAADGGITNIGNDWRSREPLLQPRFAEDRARRAGVTREDVAMALQVATSGLDVGLYREFDRLIPISLIAPREERADLALLPDRMVWSARQGGYIPLQQVIDGFHTGYEDTLVRRLNRQRTITAQGDPIPGENSFAALGRVRPAVEAIPLPPGYSMAWGGEYENSRDAQSSLAAQLPLGFLAMLLITVLLFGRVRQPLIIWLCVPMAICGVTLALLLTGLPFGFMALLGFLSLSGMLIKNAIVLVDEIDAQRATAEDPYQALVNASISRVRPVLLAAGTTILGMLPLIVDTFFADMAAAIMGGLAFATVLTLYAVPVFYSLLFRIRPAAPPDAAQA